MCRYLMVLSFPGHRHCWREIVNTQKDYSCLDWLSDPGTMGDSFIEMPFILEERTNALKCTVEERFTISDLLRGVVEKRTSIWED